MFAGHALEVNWTQGTYMMAVLEEVSLSDGRVRVFQYKEN
jgi:hypothetical protein